MSIPGIDDADDFTTTADLGTVSLSRKVAATDSHAAAEPVRATRDPIRVEMRPAGGGEVRVTASTWWVAKKDAPVRPPLASKITDGVDVWVVESVRDAAGCWACEVILG